jgi:hypothetical protein
LSTGQSFGRIRALEHNIVRGRDLKYLKRTLAA